MNITKVTVFETDDLEDIPEKPAEFIAFWTEKVNLIPDEFMSTAIITLEPETRWECGYLEMKITYTRPETNAESIHREDKANARVDSIRRKELDQLAELKKKYGDT